MAYSRCSTTLSGTVRSEADRQAAVAAAADATAVAGVHDDIRVLHDDARAHLITRIA